MLDLELPQLMLAGNDYRSYLAKNKDKEIQHSFTNYYDYEPLVPNYEYRKWLFEGYFNVQQNKY